MGHVGLSPRGTRSVVYSCAIDATSFSRTYTWGTRSTRAGSSTVTPRRASSTSGRSRRTSCGSTVIPTRTRCVSWATSGGDRGAPRGISASRRGPTARWATRARPVHPCRRRPGSRRGRPSLADATTELRRLLCPFAFAIEGTEHGTVPARWRDRGREETGAQTHKVGERNRPHSLTRSHGCTITAARLFSHAARKLGEASEKGEKIVQSLPVR